MRGVLSLYGCVQELLHLLNDHGCPDHEHVETFHCIQLCLGLIAPDRNLQAPVFRPYFYSNDISVLVDLLIREITNIPLEQAGASQQSLTNPMLRLRYKDMFSFDCALLER